MSQKWVETSVGLFILAAILGMLLLAFKVSDLSLYGEHDTYTVFAKFDNIGDLKPRAPVTIAGVKIGQVVSINLDKALYKATVTMRIKARDNNIPTDSSANIVTAGLLGSNYIAITPGFETAFMQDKGVISETNSAILLEDMIGQLIFNSKKGDKDDEKV
jgi:phospholipid/cholesterol/gamma-HCH transport system substrate-binding protein